MPGPELRITQGTTANQIANFVEQFGDNAKIRTRQDAATGETVLYASTKKNNVFSKLKEAIVDRPFDKIATKRSDAHTALSNFFGGLERGMSSTASNNIKTVLDASQGKEIKAATLKALAKIADLDRPTEIGPSLNSVFGDDPVARQVGIEGFDSFAANVGKVIAEAIANNDRGDLDNAITSLVEALPKDNLTQDFLTSGGSGFKYDLKKALASGLEDGGPFGASPTDAETKLVNKVLDTVYQRMVGAAATNKLDLSNPAQPTLTSGNKTFEWERTFGTGGMGDVFLMRNTADHSEKMIVKVVREGDELAMIPKDREQANAELRAEFTAQDGASATGSNNIVKVKGLAATQGGQLALMMEYAPLGDAAALVDKLKAAIDNRLISPKAATLVALTMGLDMASGFAAMHANGIIHGDFKPANMFIAEGGYGKIADFGTGQTGGDYSFAKANAVDNPGWMAPELAKMKSDQPVDRADALIAYAAPRLDKGEFLAKHLAHKEKTGETIDTINYAQFLIKSGLEKTLPKDLANKANTLATNVNHVVTDEARQKPVTDKIDVWSFGVSMFNLLTGNPHMLPQGFEAANTLAAIGPGNPAVNATNGTGFPPHDAFLNWVLNADPAARPSFQDVLAHPFMQQNGVGSDEARAMITALLTGNNAQIQALSVQLSRM